MSDSGFSEEASDSVQVLHYSYTAISSQLGQLTFKGLQVIMLLLVQGSFGIFARGEGRVSVQLCSFKVVYSTFCPHQK